MNAHRPRTDFVPKGLSRLVLVAYVCVGFYCAFLLLLTSEWGGWIERTTIWAIPRLYWPRPSSPAVVSAQAAKVQMMRQLLSEASPFLVLGFQDTNDKASCPLHKVPLEEGCSVARPLPGGDGFRLEYAAQWHAFFPYSRLRIYEFSGGCYGSYQPVEKPVRFCPLCRILDEAWSPKQWCSNPDDCLSLAIALASAEKERQSVEMLRFVPAGGM